MTRLGLFDTLATVAASTGGVASPMCPRYGDRAALLLRGAENPTDGP